MAFFLGEVIGGVGDRHVTGRLVPVVLGVRRGEEAEELGGCLVLGVRLAGHGEKRRATDEGLGGFCGHAFPVGQHGGGELEVHFLQEAAEGPRGPEPHGHVTVFEGLRVVAPAGAVPFKKTLFLPVDERREVGLDGVVVHEDLGVVAGVAVVVRGERQVVARHEVLGEDPGQVRLRQRDVTCVLQRRGRGRSELFPGLRRLDTGFRKRVGVVVEDRGRRVERHADHLAVGIGVEVPHARDVIVDVEVDAVLGQERFDRNRRALRTDHGGGAGVEDLKNVRLFTGPEGGDAGGQGFFVASLENRNDLVVALAGVEVGCDLVDRLAQLAAHRVPPGDFGLGNGRVRREGETGNCRAQVQKLHQDTPVRWMPRPRGRARRGVLSNRGQAPLLVFVLRTGMPHSKSDRATCAHVFT